ncbi:FitA-like ribbon-helix-helix domain-containing protein [Candidatus Palauibacter sp.]|uniref:FitA-like ribbon-helix-helix domain-containing protein n=1 Tax=Candidatus Palauibacter sp. TaxID=3101350 RepID=UPI003AF21DB1
MASITIRNLDDDVKTRLRVRAAEHHRSMEEEARIILRDAVTGRRTGPRNLATFTRECSAFRRFRSPVPTKRSPIPEDSDHLGGERRSIGALESGYGFEV